MGTDFDNPQLRVRPRSEFAILKEKVEPTTWPIHPAVAFVQNPLSADSFFKTGHELVETLKVFFVVSIHSSFPIRQTA